VLVEGPWLTYSNGDSISDFRTLMDQMFYNMQEKDTIALDIE